ncbi:hypothetical protein MiTa_00003 [Microcystis aeruginosa NIES-4264]|jgi:hypothetical protein|uniref:Uncharacterized protein n=1 Tax=Microcystis aeruginosa NIES-4285 TaxID=2497681 RepID=A0A402DC06_MICAE|nr:hypothetical protein MiTa_00003 [Microcystis aeruginosa NIES-4264]GCE59710.1 hypothetical protein MiAbB_01629 [Microcystis aeruginosa NIES-4285]
MGKGFAPVLPSENKAQLKPELPLTSINEIQASLLIIALFMLLRHRQVQQRV